MGLDINVLIADWSWLGEAPENGRLSKLRNAWYAEETGLWDDDAPVVEGDWHWPRGPHRAAFSVYEFRNTLGSFKAHFWAGERWESARDHTDRPMRAELDALLRGLIWGGMDGEAEHVDPGFFCPDPAVNYGVLLARSPDSVRELAATSERLRPRLGDLRPAFDRYAATPGAWVCDFDEFADLLEDWDRVLSEAARRGWGVVGLSQ
ncbi:MULTISPECIES: hypothetical protein [unclassified Streptomyces]|uniref:hypothetical protein n=1 Tax=unclassified Streptomyces TaxID=2593676 RepID=UPI002E315400|nr:MULTISPECIES: hypothetical protein [unclassified Streptomyces]WUC62972.1 hypothetical protein OG861_01455 [Streptomyces sp. NBC_00539]